MEEFEDSDEIEEPIKMTRKQRGCVRFWDNKNQRSQACTICKNKALDYYDVEVRMMIREWLRITPFERESFPIQKGYLCDPMRIAYIRDVQRGIQALPAEYADLDSCPIPATQKVLEEDRDLGIKRANIMNILQRSNARSKHLIDLEGNTITIQNTNLEEKEYTGFHSAMGFYEWYNHYVLNEENYDPPIPLGATHRTWAGIVESEARCMMLCPRDHFKTSFLIIGYALYCICEQLYYPIVIISLDGQLSGSTFGAIKGNLKHNTTILRDYGNIIDDKRSNTDDKFYAVFQPSGAKDPAIFCTSLKSGRITGTHPKMFMMDDIQDAPFAEVMMNTVKQIFNAKIIPAVGRGNKVVITGTIKGYSAKNDIYLWIQSKNMFNPHIFQSANMIPPMEDCTVEDKWVHSVNQFGEPLFTSKNEPVMTRRPVVFVKDREKYIPLYPERYQIEDLVAKRLEMSDDDDKGDAMFFSEYQLEASNPKGTEFQVNRVGFIPDGAFPSLESLVTYLHDFHYKISLWVDPGGKHGHGFAICVMATYNRNVYLLDLVVVRDGIPEVAKVVYELIRRYHVGYCMCEGNFEQKETYNNQIEHHLLDYCNQVGDPEAFKPFNPYNNKGDKLLRIKTTFSSLLGAKEAPIRLFVNPKARAIDQFFIEMKAFPNGVGNMKDFDLLDATCSNYVFWHSVSTRPIVASNMRHYSRI